MSVLNHPNKMGEYNQKELKTEKHDLEMSLPVWLSYAITFSPGGGFACECVIFIAFLLLH